MGRLGSSFEQSLCNLPMSDSILCDGKKCISQEDRPSIGIIQRPRI